MNERKEHGPLAGRIEELSQEVSSLAERVGRLEQLLETRAAVRPREVAPQPEARAPVAPTESAWTWASTASVLSRTAAVCFLLVVALVLRTVTDSGLVSAGIGAWVGIGYCFLLVVVGWILYGRPHPLASTVCTTGVLLLCAVVFESHSRYDVLATPTAHGLLILAFAGVAAVSWRYRSSAVACVATTGLVAAGASLDFFHPAFLSLGVFLLAANGTGQAARNLRGCGWLRLALHAGAALFWIVWASRLGAALERGQAVEPALALSGFLPLLGVYVVYYLASAYGALASGTTKSVRFDRVVPTLTVAWAYPSALTVAVPWFHGARPLGVVAVATSAGLLATAFHLSKGPGHARGGTGTFCAAGALGLALGLPAATGSAALAVPVLSAVAVGLAKLSARWRSGGARLTSYLLQVSLAVFAAVSGAFALSAPSPLMRGAVLGIAACVALYHYRWCRAHGPPSESGFFSRIDKTDDTAVGLLLASIAAAFLGLRVAAHETLGGSSGGAANAFQCAQSVIINLGALALVFAAFAKRDKKIRAVAILVIVMGGAKVFVLDLLWAHGLPLVWSVLSFGAAAALGALILGRWHRKERAA